ncbi:MAG: DNA-protecting protein DprA, partial [Chthoniobacterales bacterium]|nr:DNA-protecting protein DprA [Chthoniobacterales bacterium]
IEASETSIDDIATKSDLPSGSVSSTLLRLELKRLVKQLPGKYFVKLG